MLRRSRCSVGSAVLPMRNRGRFRRLRGPEAKQGGQCRADRAKGKDLTCPFRQSERFERKIMKRFEARWSAPYSGCVAGIRPKQPEV